LEDHHLFCVGVLYSWGTTLEIIIKKEVE
jgi:hypothetical protein